MLTLLCICLWLDMHNKLKWMTSFVYSRCTKHNTSHSKMCCLQHVAEDKTFLKTRFTRDLCIHHGVAKACAKSNILDISLVHQHIDCLIRIVGICTLLETLTRRSNEMLTSQKPAALT